MGVLRHRCCLLLLLRLLLLLLRVRGSGGGERCGLRLGCAHLLRGVGDVAHDEHVHYHDNTSSKLFIVV